MGERALAGIAALVAESGLMPVFAGLDPLCPGVRRDLDRAAGREARGIADRYEPREADLRDDTPSAFFFLAPKKAASELVRSSKAYSKTREPTP